MGCGNGVVIRTNPDDPLTYQAIAGRCHKLACPCCGPKKARAYTIAVARLCREHKLFRMMTLTLDPLSITEGTDSAVFIKIIWNKFRTLLQRKLGYSLKYVAVLEFQANGTAHLHVAINETLSQQWIRDTWEAVGGGFECNIKFIPIHSVYGYLAKYLTKARLETIPARMRKITTARGMILNPKKPPSGWQWEQTDMRDLYRTNFYRLDAVEEDDHGVLFIVYKDPAIWDERGLPRPPEDTASRENLDGLISEVFPSGWTQPQLINTTQQVEGL